MKRLIPYLAPNPIMVKELRSRMRGPRAFITLTVVLLVSGGIMFGLLQLILATSRYQTILSPQLGQGMFAALAFLELFMICAITPAVTAGAISSEKEKQTYEMLMATPLSPASILWGKLVSAMSYVLLLLFAAVPLASIVFIFGGVAPSEMVKVLLVLLVIAVTLGILGLFMSALFGRTGWATVASYITVVIITIAPLFIAVLVGVLRQGEPPRWILTPSPVSALAAALSSSMAQNDSFFQLFYVLGGIWNLGINPISQTHIPRPLYHYSLPFYAGLSLVLYLITMRLVQPTRRFQLRRREILVGAAVLLSFCGLLALAFFMTAGRYEWALRSQPPQNAREQVFPAPAVVEPAVAEERVVVVQPLDSTPTPLPSPTNVEGKIFPSTPTPLTPPDNGVLPSGDPAAGADIPADIEMRKQVYSAVINRIYTVDHTFGNQPPNWPVLYLVQTTDDGVGDPNTPKEAPLTFDDQLKAEISATVSDLPAEIVWVATSVEVGKDPQSGTVLNNGAVITLGNIHMQPDGTVHVPASVYFSSLGAGGKTYVLTLIDGVWTITGTTGVEWIS
jgi:ABC-2 type transport system permease protein